MKLPQPKIGKIYRTVDGCDRMVTRVELDGDDLYIAGLSRSAVEGASARWLASGGFVANLEQFWRTIAPDDRPRAVLELTPNEAIFLRGQMEACRETMEEMMPRDAMAEWMVNMHRGANAILEKLKTE